jgi:hypothetical protein
MDVLMGHFVYICIFIHLVDVQARMQLLTSYRMVMVMHRSRHSRHNMMQRQSGDGRYREQEKCGK